MTDSEFRERMDAAYARDRKIIMQALKDYYWIEVTEQEAQWLWSEFSTDWYSAGWLTLFDYPKDIADNLRRWAEQRLGPDAVVARLAGHD